MSIVTKSIQIAASPAEVWKLVMDPSCLGKWVTIHRKLVHADDGTAAGGIHDGSADPHARGSLEVHWKLDQCRPGELAIWKGRGPARSRAHSEYVLTPEDGGTRFDYRNDFRAPLGPLGAVVSRALVGGMPEREAKRTLERLRAQFESTASPIELV